MVDQYVPDRIRDFILKHIDSVAQIEALVLVRCNPQERWNLSQIAARLYTGETEVAEALDRLCSAGLLISTMASTASTVFRLKTPP